MAPITKLIINNQETACVSGKQIHNPFYRDQLVDPSTGKEWLTVDEADKEDAEVAVKYAEDAWPAWSSTSASMKASLIRKWSDIIVENGQELCQLESKTMGRPVSAIQAEIVFWPKVLNYMASLVETTSSTVSTNAPGFLNYTLRQPYGVTAGILPWNSPIALFLIKVAASVGAGNAIIIKSSEKAPVTPLILGKLAADAGFPPGLIQVLTGYGPTVGAALSSHMKIRKISFTGSIATGKIVQQLAAPSNLKVVTLELGGKSPAIIFADADIGSAAEALAGCICRNAGQVCVAITRIYIHSSKKSEFLAAYQAAMRSITSKIGDAWDPETTHGPLVDSLQYERVKHFLAIGKTEGMVLLGGDAFDREGYFIQPTIFVDVDDDATISRQEIFGPVSVVNTFETEEEAISRANDTEYGLNASVFTKDIDRAVRVAAVLESGRIGVNCFASGGESLDMSFVGYKQSGIGRELGPNAISAWQETKSVFVKIN